MIAYVIVAVVLALLVGIALSVRILKQYERAVIFHLGKVGPRLLRRSVTTSRPSASSPLIRVARAGSSR